MYSDPLLERLPPLLQNEHDRDQVSVQYDTNVDEYVLPKAPVTEVYQVSGRDNGSAVVFTEGEDYRLLTDDDGNPEKIDWGIGGDDPDHGTAFTVDQSFDTIISRYSAAHDDEFAEIEESIEHVVDSRQIDSATGEELDELGAIYGQLGLRRGRDDEEYRVYLKSIVDAFNGRGSLGGLKFAIASSIGTSTENIEIVEDFENLKYSIQISNVDATFMSSAINDLAELADPSVVQLDEAIIILSNGSMRLVGDAAVQTSESTGLGGDTLTLDGNSQLG